MKKKWSVSLKKETKVKRKWKSKYNGVCQKRNIRKKKIGNTMKIDQTTDRLKEKKQKRRKTPK